jgi:hypothetical protein
MTQANELWTRLQVLGAVQGDQPTDLHIPVSVRIMLGLGAWLASVLALGFLGFTLHGMLEESAPRLLLAAIAGAIALRLAPLGVSRPFAGQVGLVMACLMQLLLFWSLFDELHRNFDMGLALIAIGAISLLINSFIWRMWSTWLVIGGLTIFLLPQHHPLLLAALVWVCAAGCALLWLNPHRWVKRQALMRPLAFALGIATLALSLWHPQLSWSTGMLLELTSPVRFVELAGLCSSGLTAVNLAIVLVLMRRLKVPVTVRAGALLLIVLVGLATWITPLVSAALGLLLLGYGRGLTLLTIIGSVGLLLGLSTHYYALTWSLNYKATSMAILGAILLLARYGLLAQRSPSHTGEAP